MDQRVAILKWIRGLPYSNGSEGSHTNMDQRVAILKWIRGLPY